MSLLLLVAADRAEFAGLLRSLSAVRPFDWALDYCASARLGTRDILLAANGPGPRLAATAVDTACRLEPSIGQIVSTGFCGALDPNLALGDIVLNSDGIYADRPAYRGNLMSTDRVAVTVEEKRSLRQSGAIAVEMEWAGVAAAAGRRGVPASAVRVVSDTAGEAMPLDFNRYRTAEGRFDRAAILRAALRRPFSAIPGLLRLQRNCRFASAKLGEFIVACRF